MGATGPRSLDANPTERAAPPADSRARQARSRLLPLGLTAFFLGWQAFVAVLVDGVEDPHPRLNWDGEWYLRIATDGYPTGGTAGSPPEGFQAYAFHPLYPLLVRGVGSLPGLAPGTVAPWLNLALASVAVYVLAVWASARLGRTAAATLVVGLSVWPSSGAFQLAYTEGLALLLLVLVWRFVDDRRYGPAVASIVLLSLARPLAVPLAVSVAVVAAVHWWRTKDVAAVKGPAVVVVAAAVATVAWPVWAGVHSGDPGVYLAAHNAFAKPGAPTSPLAWGIEEPLVGILLVLVLTMTTVIGLRLLPATTPPLVRTWVVVYPLYLAVASLVTSSFLRYFMLAFPAALLFLPVARRRASGLALLVAAVALGILGATWWVPEMVPFVPDGTYP